MEKMIKNIGLDVHKNSISVGIADDGRDGEVRFYDKNMNQLDKVIRILISKRAVLRFEYETGPCGYGIYRNLTNNNMDCVVVASSKIPQQSGNRLKNDRRDSLSLARLHRAGELTQEMSANLNNVVAASEQASTNVNMVATASEEMIATVREIA